VQAAFSYRYCNPAGADFFGDLLATLFTVFKAKLKHFFNVSETLIMGLTLSVSFRYEGTTGYIETVWCLSDDNGVSHLRLPLSRQL